MKTLDEKLAEINNNYNQLRGCITNDLVVAATRNIKLCLEIIDDLRKENKRQKEILDEMDFI
jgi:hypothetical protein